jgi:hypothetical protein
LQGICTHLLMYLFISKAPRKQRPFMFHKTDAYSRALLNPLTPSDL